MWRMEVDCTQYGTMQLSSWPLGKIDVERIRAELKYYFLAENDVIEIRFVKELSEVKTT